MPVELNIIESVTELDTTVVTVVLESASEPGPAGPGVPTGGTAGQVLTKDSGTDYDTSWQDSSGGPGGGGAAEDVTFDPAGTISATDVQAAVEEVASDAATALSTHEADTTNVHGITDTAALALTANVPSNSTFNDHSARHENGGADEINIGGLDGTSTELAAHLADSSDAHDASAISVVSTTLSGTGTDVQAVFEEIDNLLDDHSARHENGGADEISIAGLDGTPTELTNHLNDTSAAHAASAISADSTTLVGTGTDVQAVLEELDNGIADHLADSSAAHAASAISFSPTGTVAATDVQAAIAEVASEAGGSPWTLAINLDGSTLTGFTSDSGSWSTNGTIISVDATGGNARIKVNTIQKSAVFVMQYDVRVLSSGILNNGVAGGLYLWDGAGDNGPFLHFLYQSGGNERLRFENDGVAGNTAVDFAWVPDTWYTVRCRVDYAAANAYVDTVWKLQGNPTPQFPAAGSMIGFSVNACKADFRNLKLWELTLPS